MKREKLLAAAFTAWVALCACPHASSAQAATGVDQRITLDVVVTDKSGNLVPGLQQQDFTIFDNKRPQPTTSFREVTQARKTDAPPLRVVFVIDEVNISFRAMAYARQQLEKYLRQDGGQLPVPMSLVIFNEKSTQVQGTPTRNGNILADSVHAISSGAPRELEGSTFQNQVWRLQTSLRALAKLIRYEAAQPGRKLLITVVNLSTGLREALVTLYSGRPIGHG